MTQVDNRFNKQNRLVRIFVSSTFKDMQEEREELVKYVFPELRKRCRERQVELTEVDLRWGLTDEQKAEGKVLPLCLAEIERCRPYFIGLLGERYGYVPEGIEEEIGNEQTWIDKHSGKSITELEIMHGVLNHPTMKKFSFFYFRDPSKSQEIETQLASSLGLSYQSEAPSSQEKLKSLKEKIRQQSSNFPQPVRENYSNVKTLGQWVLEDLWKELDKRFPLAEVPSAQEKELMDQEAFAQMRRKVYIGSKRYFERLDQQALGDNSPLVLLGESGSGKSALISNWIETYTENHPEDKVLVHFIGSTSDSVDMIKMLRRIMEMIDNTNIPTETKKVVEAFPLWLAKASAKGRFLLILDALNQLENQNHALDLNWLPEYIPSNIRLIVSTLPGPCLEALTKRNWSTITLEPIQIDERKKFIKEYLAQYSKELNSFHIEKIASAPPASNPLYLRTLLEELRVFGLFDTLEQQINYYLQANTIEELFECVLERLEKDYEPNKESQGLVKKALSLIWASRQGISETELLEILGSDEKPFQRIDWTPLYLAIEESLLNRGGLLNFFHDYLRKAVEERYLSTPKLKRKAHLQIAEYFVQKEITDRKVEELPWQYQQAEAWEDLKECITDIEMFQRLNTEEKKYELISYCLSIGRDWDKGFAFNHMLEKYEKTSPPLEELAYRMYNVTKFFQTNSMYTEVEPLILRTLSIQEKVLGPEHLSVADTLEILSDIYHDQGKFEKSEPLVLRIINIRENALGPEHPIFAKSLSSLAGLYYVQGKFEKSEPLVLRVINIRENSLGPEHLDVARSLSNLAGLYLRQCKFNDAESLYLRALKIKEKSLGFEHPDVAESLISLAHLYFVQGKYAESETFSLRALKIREKIFGPEHPDVALSLNSLADVYSRQGKYAESEKLSLRALKISETIYGSEHPDVALSLNSLADVYSRQGKHIQAETALLKALKISETIFGPEHPNIAFTLNMLADLYCTINKNTKALSLYKDAIKIFKKALGNNHPDTISTKKKLEECQKAMNQNSNKK